ncbi:YlxQ family RNA-binding protein [Alkalihalobacterium alkalinitrilicum]|uniref:YlxQ family RNA-binding protein n=1 Tax=Alkalihalobacterium alkalinitrilicum TaxID=427920 RepID=UPI0009950271|nr:YlxQ family RNA-binding protein [Alkalihalobacterium alkalinitrilicum]
MNDKQWLSLLGLAARARKVVSGEEIVLKEVRKKQVQLVIVSTDASTATAKKMNDKCTYYNTPIRVTGTREVLGQAIGKRERVVLGVIDQGFAKKLISLIDQ